MYDSFNMDFSKVVSPFNQNRIAIVNVRPCTIAQEFRISSLLQSEGISKERLVHLFGELFRHVS